MAISAVERERLLQISMPAEDRVRQQLSDYLSRTGLAAQDFARRINYSKVTINAFLSGRYSQVASNSEPVRKAIIDFISGHPILPQTESKGRLYQTASVRAIREYFYDALEDGIAAAIEGGPGTQKSFALEHLVSELNRNELAKNGHGRRAYYIYCSYGIRPNQLLKEIAIAAGSCATGDTPRIFRNLAFDFSKRRAVIVFDEAQNLSFECIETVRKLMDRPPYFGLLFAGSHQLARFFEVNRDKLEQWNRRLRNIVQLHGLTEAEAEEIVRGEWPEANKKQTAAVMDQSWAQATGGKGTVRYLSAGRLFETIRRYKRSQTKGATA